MRSSTFAVDTCQNTTQSVGKLILEEYAGQLRSPDTVAMKYRSILWLAFEDMREGPRGKQKLGWQTIDLVLS